MNEPTKTREGDQRLPQGGQECVQDLVIETMQESKRVGTERYGTPLMTFNGRKGFQDVADEVRDLFVYLTMIQRESEADRDTLVQAVAVALADPSVPKPDWFTTHSLGWDMTPLAEIAVDRIMGWVTGQQSTSSSLAAVEKVQKIRADLEHHYQWEGESAQYRTKEGWVDVDSQMEDLLETLRSQQ